MCVWREYCTLFWNGWNDKLKRLSDFYSFEMDVQLNVADCVNELF